MLYEVRTYDVKPGSIPEVEKRFGEAYEGRKKHSPLAAFWHTEIGPLNQIIHVWPYRDLQERERIRAAALKEPGWPPNIKEFIVAQRSELMVPLSVSPELKPGKLGPWFEMRTYTYAPGELPKLTNLWEKAIEHRLKFGPITAAWYSEFGGLNHFIHIWGYESLNHRVDTRDKAAATGNWPPSAYSKRTGVPGYQLVAQENKIVLPSAFSPLQ